MPGAASLFPRLVNTGFVLTQLFSGQLGTVVGLFTPVVITDGEAAFEVELVGASTGEGKGELDLFFCWATGSPKSTDAAVILTQGADFDNAPPCNSTTGLFVIEGLVGVMT